MDSVYDSVSHHGLGFYSGLRRTRIEMSTEMSALKIALLFIYFLFVDVFLVVFLMFFLFCLLLLLFFSFLAYLRINYLKLLCMILVTARARPAWGPGLFCKSPLQTKFIWYLYVCISILIPINFNKIFITLESRYPSGTCTHFVALSLLGTIAGLQLTSYIYAN